MKKLLQSVPCHAIVIGTLFCCQVTVQAVSELQSRVQQSRFPDPKPALETLLASVARGTGGPPGATRSQFVSIQEDAQWLLRARDTWPSDTDLREFTLAIELDNRLLDNYLKTDRADPEPVRIVSRDINIKRVQCRQFGGPKVITVTVTTRDNQNNEVKGLEVWYVKKGFEKEAAYFHSLHQNSSPSIDQFRDPGYYVLWTARPNNPTRSTGRKRDIEIGPGLQIAVDLPIPAG